MHKKRASQTLLWVVFLAGIFVFAIWAIPITTVPSDKVFYANRVERPAEETDIQHGQIITDTASDNIPQNEYPDTAAVEPSNDVGAPRQEGEPGKIAIILDDMGLDLRNSQIAISLPSEITLSYLPYALRLPAQTREARERGHVLMLHMPMEPMGNQNPGDYALRAGMDAGAAHGALMQAFGSFSGYVGMNNHMGSRATTDRNLMVLLAQELKQRNLFFVDSRTTANSVAAEVMQEYGVPVLKRHVFLDDDITSKSIGKQLMETERLARQRGAIIAIGHPHSLTLSMLKEWVTTLPQKGLKLVPITDLFPPKAP